MDVVNVIPLGKVDSTKASTSTPSVGYHSDFESREETFMKALKALEPDNKSHMIALCGMGGVGKTTMMEKMETVVKENRMFRLIVKVVIGDKTDPFAIQDAVADYLGIDLKERTIPARAEKLLEWFKNYSEGGKKKILVILDDIWQLVDLNDIGLSALPNQGVDFKVLLTSRSRDVCKMMGVEADSIFNVEVLEYAEAQRFFWKFIEDSDEAVLDPDLHKIGDNIVRKCGGLPIAIKTIAYALRDNSKWVWEDTLTRLPNHDINEIANEVFEVSYENLKDNFEVSDEANLDPDLRKLGDDIVRRCQGLPIAIKTITFALKDTRTRLQHHDIDEIMNEIFEVSYENLKDEQTRSVLLLCGSYPKDFDIPTEELVRYGWGSKLFNKVYTIRDARNRLNASIGQLVNANLLIESAGSIKMHYLVRAFVLNIYSKAEHASIVNHGNMSEWPANDTPDFWKRISLACKDMEAFPRDFNLKAFQIIDNNYDGISSAESRPDQQNPIVTSSSSSSKITAFIKESKELVIPFQVIKKATKNFTTVIGNGGYGIVYKGELLLSGELTSVAVKRLDSKISGQGVKEFLTEIQLLSRYKHPNLVSLLGLCDEAGEMILIYKYAEHGSLDQHLSVAKTTHPLTWEQRIGICLDTARGLDYLHNHIPTNDRVIHRDIKSANILIGHDWKAMIADFGLSKLAHESDSYVITNASGTPGYCDPAYMDTGILTKESDVYSFGVVMFEVLCGRLGFIKVDTDHRFLARLAPRYCETGRLNKIIDPYLKIQVDSDSLKRFSEIACLCLLNERDKRPSMGWVVQKLEEMMDKLKGLVD